MTGIEKFKEYFRGFEDAYVIIGGSACEMNLDDIGSDFRETKDIDMVLIIESIDEVFGKQIWKFIKEAGYKNVQKSGEMEFYRFYEPASNEYPFMLEIFSRRPKGIPEDYDGVIAPIPVDEEVSSLSAILLDDAYYEILLSGRRIIDGITLLSIDRLILFKARAWVDLTQKKSEGIHVNDRDIKKHKNDVLRLGANLDRSNNLKINKTIQEDLQAYLDAMKSIDFDVRTIGINGLNKDEILSIIEEYYTI